MSFLPFFLADLRSVLLFPCEHREPGLGLVAEYPHLREASCPEQGFQFFCGVAVHAVYDALVPKAFGICPVGFVADKEAATAS